MRANLSIVGYCCSYGGYSSADLAGASHLSYSPDVMIIRIPCVGRIDVIHILRAIRNGADAVFVAGGRSRVSGAQPAVGEFARAA